jgi:predicted GH43/DUF377 family glycosyl hydrolase
MTNILAPPQQLPGSTAELPLRLLPLTLAPDERRVILLPFVHGHPGQVRQVLQYLAEMPEAELEECWLSVRANFESRHDGLVPRLLENYAIAARIADFPLEGVMRQLLAGAYFTMEYAFQGAALFNPSIVPHPDQQGVPQGCLRFVMSLRAVGEGHLSSVVFHTGLIHPDGDLSFDPPAAFHAPAPVRPDRQYLKDLFQRKLWEMGVSAEAAAGVLAALGEAFTLHELEQAVAAARLDASFSAVHQQAIESMLWLARSNYQVRLPPTAPINQLLIFPRTEGESRGIEDMRLVRFVDDDGSVVYYGTYTAFNGSRILPMLTETRDFHLLSFHTLNGACAQNKGMALFPRRIQGHYAMCSRIDGRNLFLMYSDYVHFWESATQLATPKYPWEYRLIGNCGSPLETDEGWLLITHGVGPMRQYSIGAMLLDRDDPGRLRGRLRRPLLTAMGEQRSGYVPNVVYSCGSLIWNGNLILPLGVSDVRTAVAIVDLQALIERLLADGV